MLPHSCRTYTLRRQGPPFQRPVGGGRAPKGGKRPGFVAFSRDAARSDDEGDAGSDMDGWIAKSDAEKSDDDDDDGAPASGSP